MPRPGLITRTRAVCFAVFFAVCFTGVLPPIGPESYPTPPDAHIVSEYYSEPPDTLCAPRRARVDVLPWGPPTPPLFSLLNNWCTWQASARAFAQRTIQLL